MSSIALTHPHSAYCAFVHGVVPKWNYVMRTIKSVGLLFQPLEEVIHQHFIPALTGQNPCCKLERDLLSLPSQLGGLNIPIPTQNSDHQFSASTQISAPLTSLIISQSKEFSIPSLQSIKCEIRQTKQQLLNTQSDNIKSSSDPLLQRTIDMLSTKCSSLWLTALSIQEQGFYLHNKNFRMHYG